MIPAIGASTTGTGTVSEPRVSGDMPRLSAAGTRRPNPSAYDLGGFGFASGPLQVIASKSWLGRKLTATSLPWSGAK